MEVGEMTCEACRRSFWSVGAKVIVEDGYQVESGLAALAGRFLSTMCRVSNDTSFDCHPIGL